MAVNYFLKTLHLKLCGRVLNTPLFSSLFPALSQLNVLLHFFMLSFMGPYFTKPRNKICMFAVTRSSLLKISDPKLFFARISQKLSNIFLKTFASYVSLGTTTSCVCLLKSQRFASSVPFNVIEMV